MITSAKLSAVRKFQLINYEQIARGSVNKKFNLAVCNFSLIGEESVEKLFTHTTGLLHRNCLFIVQTLHPKIVVGIQPCQDGWRKGSWDGFKSPEIIEPLYVATKEPASIIFIGQAQE